jgi:hypothetical protein
MATVSYMICDECGDKLPRGDETKGVMKQGGQMCADLCTACTERLTVADALTHMEERATGKRPRHSEGR